MSHVILEMCSAGQEWVRGLGLQILDGYRAEPTSTAFESYRIGSGGLFSFSGLEDSTCPSYHKHQQDPVSISFNSVMFVMWLYKLC